MKDKLLLVTKTVVHALDSAGVAFVFSRATACDDEEVELAGGRRAVVHSTPTAKVGELSVLMWSVLVQNCQPALLVALGPPAHQWFSDRGNVRMAWKLDGVEVSCDWHIIDISVRYPL